jgi:hypothetical protein
MALLVTVALAAAAGAGGRGSALLFLGWLGFLMLGNGILRLLATVYFAEYCPGSVTAALLYALACPVCQGRMQLVAVLRNPARIARSVSR